MAILGVAGDGHEVRSRRADGRPETLADRKFFDLRESGYDGPIDENGDIPDYATASPQVRQALEALELLSREPQELQR